MRYLYFLKKLNKDLLNYVLVSIISSLTVLLVIIFLAINYRSEVFNYLAQGYLKENVISSNIKEDSNSKNILSEVLPDIALKNDLHINQELSVADIVKTVNPAVVSIVIYQEVPIYETYTVPNQSPFGELFPNFFFNIPQYKQKGTEKKEVGGGSGFFVTSDGLIVTNKHVVDMSNATFTVVTSDGKKLDAKVVAIDPVLDVALVKVSGNNFPHLQMGNSDSLEVGETVIAIGNALAEFKNSVSVGIVSGLSRSITAGSSNGKIEFLDQVIQTDAAINPGNSGGPLLNKKGQVVGVNVAVAQGSQNVGFALPINIVKNVIDSYKINGKIVRPYLGIRYIPITKEVQTKNNLSYDYGILVKSGSNNELAVIPGSPADKVGIIENDIILEIDGVKIDENNNFANIIRNKKVGQTITLRVSSKGIEKVLRATLESSKD